MNAAAQLSLFTGQQPPAPTAPGTAARVLATTAQGIRHSHQEPEPPDFSTFTINPESNYAADEQEAETLAAICATELKGYLFAARLLEIAEQAGRNPLRRDAREFTPKQVEELRAAVREARAMADWMLSECEDAFGMQDAERLRMYAQACVDAGIGDEVPPAPPEQPALL